MIECKGPSVQVEQTCIAECSRWSQINQGQPLKIYHDIDGTQTTLVTVQGHVAWKQDFYTAGSLADPSPYLQQAVDTWNAAYSCGNLFEIVDDPNAADVIWLYRETGEGFGFPNSVSVGTAECFCDDDATGCNVNVDHNTVWGPTSPTWASLNFLDTGAGTPPTDFVTVAGMVHVIMHELGHILGMGHVDTSVLNPDGSIAYSIMGAWTSQYPLATVQQWDQSRLDLRYPCGCEIIDEFPLTDALLEAKLTSETCPGCLALNNPLLTQVDRS